MALAVCLVIIGLNGAISLVRFAEKSAGTETFGFSAAYTSARLLVLRDHSGNLQDWNWFRAQTRRFGFSATDVFYGNPPSAAFAMLPIASLAPADARIVWTWLTLALWVAGIGLLGARAVSSEPQSALIVGPLLFCMAALYAPLRANLEEGHTYVFAFALQSACCWFWINEKRTTAGLFGGALLGIKGYGVPFMIFALLRRDWGFLRGAAAVFATLVLFSSWALGFKQWIYLLSTYRGAGFSGVPTPALQTVKSFLSLALNLPTIQSGPLHVISPRSDYFLFAVQALLLVGSLVWLSRGSRGTPSPAALSACVLLNLAFSPRAEEHAYPLAMTALLLLLPELRTWSVAAALVSTGAILLAWPFHLQDRTPLTGMRAIGDFARLWGAVSLLIAALASEYKRRKESDHSPTGSWRPDHVLGAVVILLATFYAKPWRNPVRAGPLLAVSQSDGNAITLLRLDADEREITTIPLSCKGPFGLSFVQRTLLYSSCWNDSQLSVVDLNRRAEAQRLPAARLPAWVSYRRSKDEVWISNEDLGTVSIRRASTGRNLAEISTGKGSSDIVFTDGQTRAWISNEGNGTISVLDTNSRTKILDIRVGQVPQGMALTGDGKVLLVANFGSNTISLLDTANLRQLTQIPVCRGPVDVTVASYKGSELGYASCYSAGSVGVIDLEKRRAIQEIPVGEKPFGITARARENHVYVCVGGSNRLLILDANRPSRIIRRITIPGTPLQLALAP
ncbi:MAG: glycosyltransferase 87 family protein [Bryobacteraceae bacterium]